MYGVFSVFSFFVFVFTPSAFAAEPTCVPGVAGLAEVPPLSATEIMALEQKYGGNNYAPLPVVLSKGKGARVWDVNGKEYLDFLSGIASVNQGHAHPRIVAAAVDQLNTLTHVSRAFYNDKFGPFALMMHETFGYDRVLTMNTGLEAMETAIKLARKWGHTKKGIPEGQVKIVFADGNFHGRSIGAISAATPPAGPSVFGPLVPNFVRIPFNDVNALREALKDPNVAAFVAEPIQGEGGVVVPDPGYLKAIRELTKEHNVLWVADEVQTGVGRTGKLLAVNHENVRPDIVALGKGLGGGVIPVSAILADNDIMTTFVPGDHGLTFGGNPLALRVAMESLAVLKDEKMVENAERMGQIFRDEMKNANLPLVVEVRGKGLLNAIVFDPKAGVKAGDICNTLLEAGILSKNPRDNIIRFAPPLMIEEADLREGIARIKKAIQEYKPKPQAP